MKQFLIIITILGLPFLSISQNLAFKHIEDDEYEKFFKMIERKDQYNDEMVSDGENLMGEKTPIAFDYIEWASVKGKNNILKQQ